VEKRKKKEKRRKREEISTNMFTWILVFFLFFNIKTIRRNFGENPVHVGATSTFSVLSSFFSFLLFRTNELRKSDVGEQVRAAEKEC